MIPKRFQLCMYVGVRKKDIEKTSEGMYLRGNIENRERSWKESSKNRGIIKEDSRPL